ncbi:uncharacterized protein FIBRA_05054 [Fibroporia radiculosa]|uniref:Uncharacterized protein n=1 Tax=Fibroporia radiculosa TaxID=599839 RepID=J4H3A6_9APHY|nr:uncharacterized protein FIBRA_05054 [Fibroporia radiculosa]CCM02939.1 predicted protein [Fibroporia radiculosa]
MLPGPSSRPAHTLPPMLPPRYPLLPLDQHPVHDSYLFAGSASTDLVSTLSRWSLSAPDFLLPFHHAALHQPLELASPAAGFSPTPSDASSVLSWDADPSPAPEFTHVVCNAPLVAPVPLPYHSPTFLQYDLPDDDEDLSHPPYTRRPHKRKREEDQTDVDALGAVPAKRRSVGSAEIRAHRPQRHLPVREPPLRGVVRQGRPR